MKTSEITTAQPEQTATVISGAQIIDLIGRMASDPKSDIDKMERLMAMHERVLERDAEKAFNVAMQAAQAEMPQILRTKKNESTNSKYALLEVIDKVTKPIITKHGFSMSFGTDDCPQDGHYRVTCIVSHSDGFSRKYNADVPADGVGPKGTRNKTPTHAFGSAMSYGRRYLKCMIFDIATTDDDGNGASQNYDTSIWTGRILEAADKAALDQVAADLKADSNIPKNILTILRNAWSGKNAELEASNGAA